MDGKKDGIRFRIKLNDALIFVVFAALTGAFYLWGFSLGALLLVGAEVVTVIRKAKYSFFSVFCFLINYCLAMEYLAYNRQYVYGILGLGFVEVYFFDMFLCCSVFNLILLFFIDVLDAAEKEKKIYRTRFFISASATKVYCAAAVMITLLIFPSLPGNFDFFSERFSKGIISFSGWSCIPFFFVAVSILGRRKRKMVLASTFFVVFWYVLHGERVEAMGLLVFAAIWLLNTANISRLKKAGTAAAGGLAVLLLTAVGIVRTGGSVSVGRLFTNIFVQTTACDVTNVFNCAADLYQKGGSYRGTTYLSYLINAVPYLKDPFAFSGQLILDGYKSAGGGVFLAEPYANGGIAMVILQTVVFMAAFSLLLKKSSVYRALVYVELFLAVFRISWYGLNYPIVTIIYFVPFTILINKIFLDKEPYRISERGRAFHKKETGDCNEEGKGNSIYGSLDYRRN